MMDEQTHTHVMATSSSNMVGWNMEQKKDIPETWNNPKKTWTTG